MNRSGSGDDGPGRELGHRGKQTGRRSKGGLLWGRGATLRWVPTEGVVLDGGNVGYTEAGSEEGVSHPFKTPNSGAST